jgi:Xaa-Pro aminopeptidase
MLTREGCLDRQRRLRERLATNNLDAAVISDRRDVYYLTGLLVPDHLFVLLTLETDGESRLVAPDGHTSVHIDTCVSYNWNEAGTNHPDPMTRIEAAVAGHSTRKIRRLGWQAESLPHRLAQSLEQHFTSTGWIAIDEILRTMQRHKDADELAILRKSIAANLGAYDAAREAIVPGATELAVRAAGVRGATLTAGEPVFHDGDYRCGAFNGPARDRAIRDGEIYIIDAWTTFRGYWSDLSCAFVVGVAPTDLQQSIFNHIAGVQRRAGDALRPGLHTSELWRMIDAMIREHPALADTGLIHHGGHGIGLRIHEEPDINRDRGDALHVGDVVCLEPGGYTLEARCGVRIENTYRITESAAENLSDDSVELCRQDQTTNPREQNHAH